MCPGYIRDSDIRLKMIGSLPFYGWWSSGNSFYGKRSDMTIADTAFKFSSVPCKDSPGLTSF